MSCELALDLDRCAEILDECGFLPKGRFCVVNLCGIPDGLNAKELEKYLRQNGAQTRGFASYQDKDGSEERDPVQGMHSWLNHAQMSENVLR